MEFIIVILIILITLFYLIYIPYKVISLQRQINKLSSVNQRNTSKTPNQETPDSKNVYEKPINVFGTPISDEKEAQTEYYGDMKEPEPSPFWVWLKDNWLLKVGIGLILLGVGWFVTLAFANIGPIGQITTGFFAGIILVLMGDFRSTKNQVQGKALLITGSAILLITIFAASHIHKFFDPIISLMFVFIVSAYNTIFALKNNYRSYASVGLVIAVIAPMFTDLDAPSIVQNFAYVGVVSLAALWVTFYKNWREIGVGASVSVLLYSFIFGFAKYSQSQDLVFLITMSLAVIFFVSNIISLAKFNDKASKYDFMLAISNSTMVLIWILNTVEPEWQSLITALWMIAFAIGSFTVFIKTRKINYFYIYSLIGIVFLVSATAMELEGNALIFAFIFESAIISLAGYFITNNQSVGHKFSLLMIPPAILSLQSFWTSSWYRTEILHQDFAIILCMSLVLLGMGYFYLLLKKKTDKSYVSGIKVYPYTIMIIAGTYFIFGLIWKVLDTLYIGSEIAIFLSLAIYTIIGVWTYLFGRLNSRNVYKYYGAILISLVVIRLLLIDVWEMELGVRVVTFLSIGILLASTAFIGANKNKPKEINN